MGADDVFDTVSGTHGLTGAADTILILKRTANGVVLYARGRDIEEAELAVQFNKNTCRWTIMGQAAEVHQSDERSRVIETLRAAGEPLTPNAIMTRANLKNANATYLILGRMAREGAIEKVGKGKYIIPNTQTGRTGETGRTGPANLSDLSASRVPPDRSPDGKSNEESKAASGYGANLSDLSAYRSPPLGPLGDSLDDFC
jgi:hypothetical protein